MESSSLNEELLVVRLKPILVEYNNLFCDDEERQALLLFLETNDCRETVEKCVDGDDIANAFAHAGLKNHLDILQFFLDRGINIDIKNKFGDTALIKASANGRKESVCMLLERNANPNPQDKNGWTALMWSCRFGYKDIVQSLLNNNADIELKDDKGRTAFDNAKTEQIKEMIQNHVNTSYILK